MAQSTSQYVEGEAIVTLKGSADVQAVEQSLGGKEIQITRRYNALSQLRGKHYMAVKAPGRTTSALIAELKQNSAVEMVEPNYISRFDVRFTPNDTRFSQLWGLKNTGQAVNGYAGTAGADTSFNAAWALAGVNTNEVVVAVVDTGIDSSHPDLVTNLWTNAGEIPGNGVDDDHDGYIDDVHGWNAAGNNGTITDSGSHGTHVSGTVAATGNNNRGVIGVNHRAKIMMLRASNDGDSLLHSWLYTAFDYIVAKKMEGVNIVAINASYGGIGFDSVEEAAVQSAGDVGIILCAAAGNSAVNNDVIPHYPSSYTLSNIIAVAATDQTDDLTWFSCYGATSVDLAAPGENVLSTIPTWLTQEIETNSAYTDIALGTNVFRGTNLDYSGTESLSGIILDCGSGQSYQFPPFVNGNIALIERGTTLTLPQQVANAMTAGARAAIIYNNVPGRFTGSLESSGSWINSVAISREDGLAIKAVLPAVGGVTTTVETSFTDTAYDYYDGTSMATPHVAGAVAFAAMNFPEESMSQRIQRILTNVDVLPSLSGLMTTGGRLNLQQMVDTDNNGLPDWWERQYFGHYTGTDTNADFDGDGATEWNEWVAGTNPTNAQSCFKIVSVVDNGNGVDATLTWTSLTNRSYQVERAVDLFGGSYQSYSTVLSGGEGTTSFSIHYSYPTGYFRVSIPAD